MRVSFSPLFLATFWAVVLGATSLAAPADAQIHPLPVTGAGTSFGAAVALSGGADGGPRRAVVGASGEDTCGPNSGAVYVFEKPSDGAWEQTARLTPSDCEARAFFGRSIALSGDRVLIGASKEFFADERPNVAYVFEHDPATESWAETARLTVDPRRREGTFAASVALDGDRALVTSRGRLPLFGSERPAREPGLAPSGDGAAYVFEHDARTRRWHRTARLTPPRPHPALAFGGAGALDGDHLVVTASSYSADAPGAVHVFERRGPARGESGRSRWMHVTRLDGFDAFSISVALDAGRLLVGESRAGRRREGRAVLFERTTDGAWQRQARLAPATAYRDGAFGTSVSLDGDRALVTGYDEQLGLDFNIDRVVYVFRRSDPSRERPGRPARWVQRQILDVGDVAFGATIDHDGPEALVGYVPDRGPGAVYAVGLR